MPTTAIFDPAYRFWHLRRFWQLCLIPPMLGILFATLYPANSTGIATPFGAGILMAIWACGAAIYLVLWPRLPLEVLALALTLGLCVAVAPAIALIHPSLLALMFLALPAIAFALVTWINRMLCGLLFVGPGVGRHLSASGVSDLCPERVIRELRIEANLDGPMLRTGPMASDGTFRLCFPLPPEIQLIPHSPDNPSDPQHGDWECVARIVDESPYHQLQSLIPQSEPHKETRVLLRAEPNGQGSLVWMDEFETGLPLGCALMFGLIGLQEDYLRARIDHAQGRPSPAIRWAAPTSPLKLFARWMAREKAATR